ncbi:MAG: TolC family protein [Cyanobacteria bacterium J06642_2]
MTGSLSARPGLAQGLPTVVSQSESAPENSDGATDPGELIEGAEGLPPLRGEEPSDEFSVDADAIEVPLAPPTFTAPDDAEVPPPATAEDLEVPQSPLQIRISATRRLSLDDALQLALDNNPDIDLARLAVESAFEAVREARAEYTPQVDIPLQYQIDRNSLPLTSSDFLALSLRASYSFFTGGAREARNRVADANLDIARTQLDQTTQVVRLNVAETYYNLQRADAQVQIAEAAVENSEANLRDTEAQFRAGIGTRFEVLQAETELATDRQDLLRAQNDQQLARRLLAELLNFENPTDALAVDEIQPTQAWEKSLEDTILEAFQKREELEIQRDAFESARQQAQLALSGRRPQIDGVVTYDVRNDFNDVSAGVGFVDGYTIGINMTWLILDGGATEARAKQADVDALTAIRTFERDRNAIRRDVEDAFLSLNSNREQIEVAKLAVSTARESLRLARLRFQAGVGTQTDVINQQTALTEARANLADAVIGYNLSIVQLERAVSNL